MPRTPSKAAHENVVRAAVELIAERGVDGASMDAIAERSGVSKATIYKHWKDKEALLLELMAEITGLRDRPHFDSGNTRADIIDVLAYRPTEDAELRDRLVPHLAAYAARNHEFGGAWRNMLLQPAREELRRLIRQGTEKGDLGGVVDVDLALALLLGPMLYWHIFLGKSIEDRRPLATGVVDAFWNAYGLRQTRPGNAP